MYVITRNVQTELVVQKSRFLTSLYRVSTEIEAQAKIKALKKEYWDANHNCTAYIVGIKPRAERSSDDGEPAGTAGAPMLEVLRQKELYNVVAVVTRYFGGIKLGTSGLIVAYKAAAAEANWVPAALPVPMPRLFQKPSRQQGFPAWFPWGTMPLPGPLMMWGGS